MFFLGCGRYKEQLKLLTKPTKFSAARCFFKHRGTETLKFFVGAEDTESS